MPMKAAYLRAHGSALRAHCCVHHLERQQWDTLGKLRWVSWEPKREADPLARWDGCVRCLLTGWLACWSSSSSAGQGSLASSSLLSSAMPPSLSESPFASASGALADSRAPVTLMPCWGWSELHLCHEKAGAELLSSHSGLYEVSSPLLLGPGSLHEVICIVSVPHAASLALC